MIKDYTFEITAADAAKRLDVYIKEKVPMLASRAYAQYLITQGLVKVNNQAVKSNYRLKTGDQVACQYSPRPALKVVPQDIKLDILYEDDDVLVINKPAGMVVHPAPGNPKDTLANAILAHCQSISQVGPQLRPGIVHRIDKDTSGILVVAKNDSSLQRLSQQFKAHTIKRVYLALVEGQVPLEEGEISLPIGRHPRQREKMAVVYANSRPAVTYYRVLKRYGYFTLLELTLFTGRTHQIRVHMSYFGHPIIGDLRYGRKSQLINRQALHARTLGFTHPRTNQYMEFNREPPPDMQTLILS